MACSHSSSSSSINCQRRVEELVACLSMFGACAAELTPAYAAAAHAMLGGDGAAAEAFAATLEAQHTSCSGLLHVSSSGSEQEPLAASLAFSMPPAYPGAAALECHVQSSARLPRDTVDALSARLQAQAQAAQGSECLHQLAETLMAQLDKLQEQQQVDAQTQQQAGDDSSHGGGVQRVLLRLDHMRDRQGYTATIKQWAGELELTGWLLFWQSLILICLEGSGASVAAYLTRARTVCVDVDSAGRKCRERMMTVLEDTAHPGSGSTGSTQHEPARQRRCCAAFVEVAAGSLDEVVAQLRPTYPHLDGAALRQQLLGLARGGD